MWRARTAELALHTLALASTVTLASTVLGVGLAFAAVRVAGGRALVVGLLAAPLAVPSYVSGFAWTRLFIGFEGYWAAVLVLTAACYPLVLLPAAAALASAGRSLEDVSRTVGRGPLRTFTTVTLRRIRPAVAGGALLVALYALGDFGGPASVRFESFTVGIYNAYNGSFDRTVPAVYSIALIVVALLLTAAQRAARGNDAPTLTAVERSQSRQSWAARFAARGAMVVVVGVALGVPVVGLVREVVQSQRIAAQSVGEIASWVWPDLLSTAGYGLAGAVAVTVLAIPVAMFTAGPRRRGAGVVESVVHLGYALPGITVGLAFVFVGIRLGRQVYLSPGLLIVCYAVLFLPLAVGPIRSSLEAIPDSLADAARTLGATEWAATWRVLLPVAAPSIAAGAVLAGLTIAKELPATLLLRPIGTQTLATHMWSLSNDGATGEAAVLALVLIVATAVPTAVLSSILFTQRGVRR